CSRLLSPLLLLTLPRPPCSPLFPYTTLFRSKLANFQQVIGLKRLAATIPVDRREQHGSGGGVHCLTDCSQVTGGKMLKSGGQRTDRKSTRLNSSHVKISYAVFCLKKKKQQED